MNYLVIKQTGKDGYQMEQVFEGNNKVIMKGENVGRTARMTMSVDELSKELGLSRIYCYELVRRPDFYPAFKVGRRILINVNRLEQWMNEQGNQPVSR